MLRDITYIVLIAMLLYGIHILTLENSKIKKEIYSLEQKVNELSSDVEYYKRCCESVKNIKFETKISKDILLFVLSNSKIKPENKYLIFLDVATFVYNLSYEYEEKDFWKHPVETFWDRGGDCEDRALLMCYFLSDYFKTYLVFTKNHTFCAVEYDCEEFNKKLNESLEKYNLALKNKIPCISGYFTIYYISNGYVKNYSRRVSLVSFEAPNSSIEFLYLFNERLPENTSLNLKLFYFPELLINAKYFKRGEYYHVKLILENPSFVGGVFTLVYDNIAKTIEVGPKEKKELELTIKSNKILIKNQFGEEKEITFS